MVTIGSWLTTVFFGEFEMHSARTGLLVFLLTLTLARALQCAFSRQHQGLSYTSQLCLDFLELLQHMPREAWLLLRNSPSVSVVTCYMW